MSVPPTIAWLATLLVCVAYVGISLGVAGALSTLRPTESSNARAQAGLLIGRAFVGQSLALAVLAGWLAWHGWSLARLGLTSPGDPAGWLAAAAVVALFAVALLRGPLRGVASLGERSAFRIFGTTTGVFVGGFEEVVFRGFVMAELAAASVNPLLQVLASALLWSLAHFRWGRRRGGYDWRLVLGAMGNTFILGLAFGGVYLLGGRSLWPAIAAHSGFNLLVEPWLVLARLTGRLGSRAPFDRRA